MTREQAIKELTDLLPEEFLSEYAEAIRMAIEALQKEPCGDCISRQAVDDAIYDYSRSCDVNYAQIMEFIDKLPSVTPQPKMGRWERDQFTNQPTCSACGYKVFGGQTRYCPNCGRKMEVGENG